MALNIPLPDAPDVALGKAFTQGTDLYKTLMNAAIAKAQARNQAAANAREAELFPFKKSHLQALANSAQANADWNNFLMGRAPESQYPQTEQETNENNYSAVQQKFPQIGNKPSQQPVDETEMTGNAIRQPSNIGEEIVLKQGNPKLSMLDEHAGIKGIPAVQTHYDSNGNLISRYPSGKTTMQKIAPSSVDIETAKSIQKGNQKAIDEITKQQPDIFRLNETFKRYHQLVNEPEWGKIHQNIVSKRGGEYGRKATLEYLKNYGTEKQKDLIARVEKQSNEIVATMANGFKGAFKLFEKDTIEKMKPQAWDTPTAQKAKLSELERAFDIQKYINKRVPELIRKGNLNSDEAFVQAMNEVDAPKFIEDLDQKYGFKEEQKTVTEQKEEQKTEQTKQVDKEGKDFLTAISSSIIDVIPEATPENLIDLAQSENKSAEEIAKEFVAKAKEIRMNKQGAR